MTSQQHIRKDEPFAGKYELLNPIDQGGFANVWRARHIQGGNEVALKIYAHQNTEGVEIFKQEYAQFANLRHQALANASDFDVADGCPFLVMPYYSGGNAGQLIGKFTESDAAQLMRQVGGALAYLHERNVMHQDIKPNNFLRDKDGNFLLSDLGLSFKTRTTMLHPKVNANTSLNSQKGSTPPCYRAPELFGNKNKLVEPIKATDVWAFGASIFELITGEVPFGELGGIEQKADPSVPQIPNAMSSDFKNIVTWCLDAETWERPTAAKLLEWARHFESKGTWFASDDVFVAKKRGFVKPTPQPRPMAAMGSRVEPTPSVSWRKWAIAATVLLFLGAGVKKTWSYFTKPSTSMAEVTPTVPTSMASTPTGTTTTSPVNQPITPVVTPKSTGTTSVAPVPKPSTATPKPTVTTPKPTTPVSYEPETQPTVVAPITYEEPRKPTVAPPVVRGKSLNLYFNERQDGGGIYMTNMRNEGNKTIIDLEIPYKGEKSGYGLSSMPFKLKADGVDYPCIDMTAEPTEGFKEIPKGGVHFSVYFERIPNDAKHIRIVERTQTGKSKFWRFEFDLPNR